MMDFGYYGLGHGFSLLGWIFMILWWVIIAVAIFAVAKWIIKQFGSSVGKKSAMDILKDRYAKGEIDKKEFEDKKKDLL